MQKAVAGRTALITGGAGFLGSHLCDRLLSEGRSVICLDSLRSGRRSNIGHLLPHPRFKFVLGDVCEPLPDLEIDEIWNLACPASPPRYQADPIHTLLTSVLGARHCLELARRTNARMFHASTSEVYGDPQVHPQPESYTGSVNPIGPRACYDEGKRAAEALCFDYARTHGVAVKVVRIFNTYGPRMDPADGRVVSNFVVRALKDEPLELYGDGAQTRSFCYIDDLIEGFLRLMEAPASFMGPVNLGNPAEFTVSELATLVLELTASNSEIVRRAPAIDDPRQRRPDISQAQTHLGWSPRVPLAEGLAATIAHFETVLGAEPARTETVG